MTDEYQGRKIRDLIIEIHTMQRVQLETLKDHEKRLRAGEKWRNTVMGMCLTVGGLAGASFEAVTSKITNFLSGG